jgi:hypothetical protein
MTATEVETPRTDKAQRDQRTGRMFPTAVAVGGLWLAMALSSLFAPDLISDAQDQVPIVALTIWIWGAVATGFVLFGAAFPARDRMGRWGLPVAVLGYLGRGRAGEHLRADDRRRQRRDDRPGRRAVRPARRRHRDGVRVPGGCLGGRVGAAPLSVRRTAPPSRRAPGTVAAPLGCQT